jgi:hypothetical protein
MLEDNKQAESLEERQWRLKLEQARALIAEEEAEWKALLSRAQAALENEEREWERLRMRAAVKSSGEFAAQPDSAPARRGAPSGARAQHVEAGGSAREQNMAAWP